MSSDSIWDGPPDNGDEKSSLLDDRNSHGTANRVRQSRTRTSSGTRASTLLCIAIVGLVLAGAGGIVRMVMKESSEDFKSLFSFSAPANPTGSASLDDELCHSPATGYSCNREQTHRWGQYSPFWTELSTADFATDSRVVEAECKLDQVYSVYRHGSRWSTPSRSERYVELVDRLKKEVPIEALVDKWAFFKDFEFIRMPTAGLLTDYGRQEMEEAGVRHFEKYGHLLASRIDNYRNNHTGQKDADVLGEPALFIRAGDVPRVVESGQRFLTGFYKTSQANGVDVGQQLEIVRIPEDGVYNNTLHHSNCPAFEGYKDVKVSHHFDWAAQFATPIANRLSNELGGVAISVPEVVVLFELCAFETSGMLATHPGELHPLCGLFSDSDEFASFDYYYSLAKYYNHGPGGALGAAQGVGWVREVIAKFTRTPVQPVGSINITLDSDPTTFANQDGWDVSVDIGHDNDMMAYFSTLGLFPDKLPTDRRTRPEDAGGYSVGWVATFGARMHIEKLTCGVNPTTNRPESRVRVVVNERSVPMKWCATPAILPNGRSSDDTGLEPATCLLETFVDGIMAQGDFGWSERCYV